MDLEQRHLKERGREKVSFFTVSLCWSLFVADILATISLSCHILSSTSSFLQTQHNGLQMMFFHPGCLWKQTVLLQTECPNGGGLSKTCFYYILKVPQVDTRWKNKQSNLWLQYFHPKCAFADLADEPKGTWSSRWSNRYPVCFLPAWGLRVENLIGGRTKITRVFFVASVTLWLTKLLAQWDKHH